MPADRYLRDLELALPWLGAAALALAAPGSRRAPALGAVVLAVVVPHQLLDYRVWRFLHPALPLLVVLAALGARALVVAIETRAGQRAARAVVAVLAIATSSATLVAWRRGAPWQTTWLFDRGGWDAIERARGLCRAYLELSARPPPAVVLQSVLPAAAAPGHALLGHDAEVVPVLDAGLARYDATRADAWILHASQPTPPAMHEVWSDDVSGVRLLVRR
jgi:hypothetical protein